MIQLFDGKLFATTSFINLISSIEMFACDLYMPCKELGIIGKIKPKIDCTQLINLRITLPYGGRQNNKTKQFLGFKCNPIRVIQNCTFMRKNLPHTSVHWMLPGKTKKLFMSVPMGHPVYRIYRKYRIIDVSACRPKC